MDELLPLDVPFLPDPDYLRKIRNLGDRVAVVYTSLFDPRASDARPPHHHARNPAEETAPLMTPAELAAQLLSLPGSRKYVLVNSAFQGPGAYEDASLERILAPLRTLLAAGALDGLVYSDGYLLAALGAADPALAMQLEAIPSVNCRLDTADKIYAQLDFINACGFAPPSRVVLDRALNRRLSDLRRLAARLRQSHPRLALSLLANEGCLYQCPFKTAHDAHLAYARAHPQATGRGFTLNANQGCQRLFHDEPGRMLASPFIRPEDQRYYHGVADSLKLCGRSRGPRVMGRILDAYAQGRFPGNLLTLLDSQEALAETLHLPNEALPARFHQIVSGCDKHCATCGWCEETAWEILQQRAPRLSPMEEP